MSIFGEPLPHEDDTAASLIRRTGFPPEGTYDQMPQAYLCPCCSEFSDAQERDRVARAAKEQKEAERRRLMQLDVFDERARPLPSEDSRRKLYRRVSDDPTAAEAQDTLPPLPTLDDLRRAAKQSQEPPAKLIVTVHHGKNLQAASRDRMSVVVRCGSFEGQTAQVPRGKEVLTTWDELFEFPYPNPSEHLEVLVLNDALPDSEDHLLGGIVVPAEPLHDRQRGDRESLPVMPEDQMHDGFDTAKEGPKGAVVVSWYISKDGEDGEDGVDENKNLENPLGCTFVVHRVFQYTDNGSEAYPGGILCVLRDTDDNCSESIVYSAGSMREPSLSPYYSKEGFHYLPENPSQIMQLNTEKKLGHILVCVPKQEGAPAEEEDEELLVVGAVPLDFERLYHKGRAVLLIESKSKDDALWGEISIEWLNKPITDEDEVKPLALEVQKESLFLTVVRGLNLTDRTGRPVDEAHVSVATGDMEGTTVSAPNVQDGENTHVIHWNQEVRFIDVPRDAKDVEVYAFEKDRPICVGHCELNDNDEGVVVVRMHDLHDESADRGEVVISYKRLHAPATEEEQQAASRALALDDMAGDEEHEEEEEEEEEEGKEGMTAAGDKAEEISHGEKNAEDTHDEEQEERAAAMTTSEVAERDGEEEDDKASDENGQEYDEKHHDQSDEDMYPTEDQDEAQNDRAISEEQQDDSDEDQKHHDDGDEDQKHHAQGDEDEKHHDDSDEDEKHHAQDDEDEKHHGDSDEDEKHHDDSDEDEKHRYDSDEDQKHHAQGDEGEKHHDDGDEDQKHHAQGDEDEKHHAQSDEDEKHHAQGDEDEKHHGDSDEDEKHHAQGDEDEKHRYDSDEDQKYHAQGDEDEKHRYDSDEDEKHHAQGDEDEKHRYDSDEDEKHHDQGDDDMYPTEGQGEADHQRDENADDAAGQDANEGDDEEVEDNHGDDMYPTEEPDEHGGAHGDADLYPARKEGPSFGDSREVSPAPGAVPKQKEGTSPKNIARRPSVKKMWDERRSSGYKQPWFPAGNPQNENHLPYEKTRLSRANRESIDDLEVRRSRVVEESVRRGLTPQRNTSRRTSPRAPSGSQDEM